MRDENVGDAAARSVQGAQGGLADLAVGTTPAAMDMREWKGRYVKLSASGASATDGSVWLWYVWSATAAAGAGTIDPTVEVVNGASPSSITPDVLPNLSSAHEIVPKDRPYLHYRSNSGTINLHVRRS